jgi:hypothetical protein
VCSDSSSGRAILRKNFLDCLHDDRVSGTVGLGFGWPWHFSRRRPDVVDNKRGDLVTVGDWYVLLPPGVTALLGVGWTTADHVGGRRRARTVLAAVGVAGSRTGLSARVDQPPWGRAGRWSPKCRGGGGGGVTPLGGGGRRPPHPPPPPPPPRRGRLS